MAKSLREFAQFVGKPASPISPRALVDYLLLKFPSPLSVRELVQSFDQDAHPVALEAISVEPSNRIVPFQVGMQITKAKGYILGAHWRILRGGQQVAVYDVSKGVVQVAHTFTEPGTYTVEATVKGIGSTGYAEATKSVQVVAKPKSAPPPTEPPPTEPPPTEPDLVFTGPATFNTQTKRIEIGFRNAGSANAGAFRVSAQVNNNSLGELVFNSLNAGQVGTASFSPVFLSPGDYTYRFVLDLYNTVKESNESNNAFFGTFNIP